MAITCCRADHVEIIDQFVGSSLVTVAKSSSYYFGGHLFRRTARHSLRPLWILRLSLASPCLELDCGGRGSNSRFKKKSRTSYWVGHSSSSGNRQVFGFCRVSLEDDGNHESLTRPTAATEHLEYRAKRINQLFSVSVVPPVQRNTQKYLLNESEGKELKMLAEIRRRRRIR